MRGVATMRALRFSCLVVALFFLTCSSGAVLGVQRDRQHALTPTAPSAQGGATATNGQAGDQTSVNAKAGAAKKVTSTNEHALAAEDLTYLSLDKQSLATLRKLYPASMVDVDGYGDFDVDAIRDDDTSTPDVKKDLYSGRRSYLDDPEPMPALTPLKVSEDLVRAIQNRLWSPTSNVTGNLNDEDPFPFRGFVIDVNATRASAANLTGVPHTVYKEKALKKEPERETKPLTALEDFILRQTVPSPPLVPSGIVATDKTKDSVYPKVDLLKIAKGKKVVYSSDLPMPTADWVYTRFPTHSDQAGNGAASCHSTQLLRKWMDFVGIDKNIPSGVELRAVAVKPVPSIGDEDSMDPIARRAAKKHNRTQTNDTLPSDIENTYYFWQFVAPLNQNFRTRRCYDTELVYEKTVDQIGPDSQEVSWGCMPFRAHGIQMQGDVACAAKSLGAAKWELHEEKIMQRLALEAQRRTQQDFDKKLVVRFNELLLQPDPALVDAQGRDLNLNNSDVNALVTCFKGSRRSAACLPVLGGSLGMRGHGITDQSKAWVENSMMAMKTCNVPAGCSRLAAERLMHFNLKHYDANITALSTVNRPTWNNMCRNGGDLVLGDGNLDHGWFTQVTSSNDRLFASCFFMGIRRMCGEFPECCPTFADHLACKQDLHSQRCENICASGI